MMKKVRLFVLGSVLCMIASPAFADLYGSVDVRYEGLVRGMDLSLVSSLTETGNVDTLEAGLVRLSLSNPSLGGTGTVPIPGNSFFNLGYTVSFREACKIFEFVMAAGGTRGQGSAIARGSSLLQKCVPIVPGHPVGRMNT